MTRENLIDAIAMAMEAWSKNPQGVPASQLAGTFVELTAEVVAEETGLDRSGDRSEVIEAHRRMTVAAVTRVAELEAEVAYLNEQISVMEDP